MKKFLLVSLIILGSLVMGGVIGCSDKPKETPAQYVETLNSNNTKQLVHYNYSMSGNEYTFIIKVDLDSKKKNLVTMSEDQINAAQYVIALTQEHQEDNQKLNQKLKAVGFSKLVVTRKDDTIIYERNL